jgi:hypothetical protein
MEREAEGLALLKDVVTCGKRAASTSTEDLKPDSLFALVELVAPDEI